MGEVRAQLTLRNDGDVFNNEAGRLPKRRIREAMVDAIVDTGAVMVLLPLEVVQKLGLRIIDKTIVTLADDRRIELDRAGTLSLTVAGREMKTDCLVGPPNCEALVGQLVLERLDLIVDPAKRTLAVRPESPFLPSLKLKGGCVASC